MKLTFNYLSVVKIEMTPQIMVEMSNFVYINFTTTYFTNLPIS